MNKYTLEISTLVAGERQNVGNVDMYYPTLQELGFDVLPKDTVAGAAIVDQGIPVYASEAHDFTFQAVLASIKAMARNKLVSKTVTLRPGAKIAETLEELFATPERDGAAIKLFREMLAGFTAFIAKTSGKSQLVQASIVQLAGSKKNILLQPAGNKAKLEAYMIDFATSLDADQAILWQRPIQGIVDACSGIDPLDDM